MAHPMETTRVYLDDHQRGVVTCPHCGDTQALNMARYPDAPGRDSSPRALRSLWPRVSPPL